MKMEYPSESDVRKLGVISRILAGFILLCSVMATAGLIFVVVTESFHPIAFIIAIVVGVMMHVSGSIAFRGYAPRYLLFAHGPK